MQHHADELQNAVHELCFMKKNFYDLSRYFLGAGLQFFMASFLASHSCTEE